MIHLVPIVPIPLPQPVQPEIGDTITNMVNFIVNSFPVFAVIFVIPLALRGAAVVIKIMSGLAHEEPSEKPKRESISFFDAPTEEPDYVVGFGDDGEMIYASEKRKRKNDEVD